MLKSFLTLFYELIIIILLYFEKIKIKRLLLKR